jgi:hypothetical protein
MTTRAAKEKPAPPSTDDIRLMADLILAICRCRQCGQVPPEEELLDFLASSSRDLNCSRCQNGTLADQVE